MLICHGCGQAFEIPADYSRNKIQCPGCGVIVAVPADAPRKAAAPPRAEPPRKQRVSRSVEDEAASWLTEADPVVRKPERERALLPVAPTPDRSEAIPIVGEERPPEPEFRCRRCGRRIGRLGACEACEREADELLSADPDEPLRQPVGLAPRSMELDDEPLPMVAEEDEDDDSPSPYSTAEPDLPRCPKCRKDMAHDAAVCLSCGFNRRTRKKAKRTFQPLARSWEADMPLGTRLSIIAGIVGFHLFLTVGAALGGHAAPFLVALVPLLGILCFVLGTYDTTTIIRDDRGRVTVSRQWRFFFVPTVPEKTDARGYLGVLAGGWNDSGIMEWFICILLICVGLVPAFLWWYIAIYCNHYHVALAEDHGRATFTVYRGRSEEQMHEIAQVLTDASGLKIVT